MINIREIGSSDLDQVKKFISTMFPKTFIQIREDDFVLLAEMGPIIVGFLHASEAKERFILQGIGVHPNYRKMGVGSMLIAHFLSEVEMLQKPIYLKVKSLNPAIELYTRFGFFIKRCDQKQGVYILVKKTNN